MDHTFLFHYEEFGSVSELAEADRQLMQVAIEATHTAYNPYSHFSVGAAIRLNDGTLWTGSNQENIAYPSGLCAERTALFSAAAHHPQATFEALAIVGRDASGQLVPASPCGACRQVMSEYEQRQHSPLRLLLYNTGGKILIFESAADLLPFSFSM